jgi:sulfatase maturation enzyme AslB (radical SAM superfamily)
MRYTLRDEFFGALCYDRTECDYIHLDHLALRLLREPDRPLDESELKRFDTDESEVRELIDDLRARQIPGNYLQLANKPVKGMLSAPTRIFLEITYRCPEKCTHCYTESGERHDDELSLAEKFSIVDQMAEIGCYRLSIAGGEPLVDRDFFPVVERAIDHHIDVSFSTSGIPVSVRVAKQLAALDIRTINISLDGWDEDSYG